MNSTTDISKSENNPLRLRIIKELDNIQKKREAISEIIFRGCTNPRESFNPIMTELTESNRNLSTLMRDMMGNDFLDKDTLVDRALVNQECVIKVTVEYKNFDNGKKTFPEFSQAVMSVLTTTEEKEKKKNIIKITTQKPILFDENSNNSGNNTSSNNTTTNNSTPITSSSNTSIFGPMTSAPQINSNLGQITGRKSIQFDDLLGIGQETIDIRNQQTQPQYQSNNQQEQSQSVKFTTYESFSSFDDPNNKFKKKQADVNFETFGNSKKTENERSKNSFTDFSDFGATQKSSSNANFSSFDNFSSFGNSTTSSSNQNSSQGNTFSDFDGRPSTKRTSAIFDSKPERASVGFLSKDPNAGLEKIERRNSETNNKNLPIQTGGADRFNAVDQYMNAVKQESQKGEALQNSDSKVRRATSGNINEELSAKKEENVARKGSIGDSKQQSAQKNAEAKPVEAAFDANVKEIIAAQKRFVEAAIRAQEIKAEAKESLKKPEVKNEDLLKELTTEAFQKTVIKEVKEEKPVEKKETEPVVAEKPTPKVEIETPVVKEVTIEKKEEVEKIETGIESKSDNQKSEIVEPEKAKLETVEPEKPETKLETIQNVQEKEKTVVDVKKRLLIYLWTIVYPALLNFDTQISIRIRQKLSKSQSVTIESPSIKTTEQINQEKSLTKQDDVVKTESEPNNQNGKSEEKILEEKRGIEISNKVSEEKETKTENDEKIKETSSIKVESKDEKKIYQLDSPLKPEKQVVDEKILSTIANQIEEKTQENLKKITDIQSGLSTEVTQIKEEVQGIKQELSCIKSLITEEFKARDEKIVLITNDIQSLKSELSSGIKQILELLQSKNKSESEQGAQ